MKTLGYILCVMMVAACAAAAIYSEFASVPETVTSRWSMEWYWFVHLWYMWVIGIVGMIGFAWLSNKD